MRNKTSSIFKNRQEHIFCLKSSEFKNANGNRYTNIYNQQNMFSRTYCTDVTQLERFTNQVMTQSEVYAVVQNRWILLRECFEKLKFVRVAYLGEDIDRKKKKRNCFNTLGGSFHTVENEASEPVEGETSTR